MSLEKDLSVRRFLEAADLDARGLAILDHWEADRYAIGIARADNHERLVYISTWQREAGRFRVELETSALNDPAGYVTEHTSEDCDQAHAVRLIKSFLMPPAGTATRERP